MSRQRSKRFDLPPAQENVDKLEKIVKDGNYYGAQQMYKSLSARTSGGSAGRTNGESGSGRTSAESGTLQEFMGFAAAKNGRKRLKNGRNREFAAVFLSAG
ncbi:hypothetical protein P8452_52505 [Trifolium repens]|nr:hypothetical protein P8452_52505 [Trifolium repens]